MHILILTYQALTGAAAASPPLPAAAAAPGTVVVDGAVILTKGAGRADAGWRRGRGGWEAKHKRRGLLLLLLLPLLRLLI